MVAAVAQLAVVQVGFLGTFTCQLGDTGNGFALFLGVLYLLQHHFGDERVLVKVVVHFRLDEVSHVFVYCGAGGFAFLRHGGPHVVASQFRFGLALEHGFLHVDGDGGYQAVAYVGILLVLVVELLDGTGNVLFQGSLVCTALGGVLSVDKGVVLFAVLAGVREGYLDVFSFQVYDVVKAFAGHVVFQQVLQSVAGNYALSVVNKGKPRIQVGVVAQQRFYKLVLEGIVVEERVVRLKEDISSVFFRRILGCVAQQRSSFKDGGAYLAVAVAAYLETVAQRIDRLDTHTVQPDAFLESLAVVLSSGVQLADRLYQLALRNASAVVAHADAQIVFYSHFYAFSGTHLELVDAVVHHFFQQHIDAVIVL